jgi:hypothetical protein
MVAAPILAGQLLVDGLNLGLILRGDQGPEVVGKDQRGFAHGRLRDLARLRAGRPSSQLNNALRGLFLDRVILHASRLLRPAG